MPVTSSLLSAVRGRLAWLLLLGLLPSPGLSAQAPAARAEIAAFRDSLAGVTDTLALKALETRLINVAKVRRDSTMLHLRLGFLSLRMGDLGGHSHYDDAGSEFEWATRDEPKWPIPWLGLGLAELGVGDSQVAVVQGMQTMLGRDALTRSANAFARSAEVDPAFIDGLVELANTALKQRINTRLDVSLAALRRAARTPSARQPAVLLARARVEREVGSPDSSLAALNALLTLNRNDPVTLVELAKTRFLLGRDGAVDAWYRGLQLADSVALPIYRSDLATIMPDSTLRAFDAARGDARVALVRRFWEVRDRDELHGSGERLREHYRRLDFVRRNFRLVSVNRQFDIAERYRSNQTEYDDRGIIYLRHGEPDDRASLNVPGIEPNESWNYRRVEGNLLFHFVARQDVQDYRLVESVFDILGFATAVAMRNGDSLTASANADALLRSRDRMDPIYSRLLGVGRGGAAQLVTDERSLGRRSIARGTASDSWPLRYGTKLAAQVDVLGVGSDSVGPQLQIVFALPGSALTPIPMQQGVAYVLRLRAAVVALDGSTVALLDTTRRFAAKAPVPAREHLLGRQTLRVPPGIYTIRLALETDLSGMVSTRDTLRVASPLGPGVGVSDLALGTRSVNLPMRGAAGDSAWFNPLRSFRRAEPMQLYFEVSGLAPGTPYRIELAVSKPNGRSIFSRIFGGGGAAIKIAFDGTQGAAGVTPVQRELSLEKLKPGTYSMDITVTAPNGAKAVRHRTFTVV
ncbi:MAG: GWxTD domain-containing protein [Gemmatimonadota bacterium]